jgi:hypothetical protein
MKRFGTCPDTRSIQPDSYDEGHREHHLVDRADRLSQPRMAGSVNAITHDLRGPRHAEL